MNALAALQRAVVARLKAHPSTASYDVYDASSVPQTAEWPFYTVQLVTAGYTATGGPAGPVVHSEPRLSIRACTRSAAGTGSPGIAFAMAEAGREAIASAPLTDDDFHVVTWAPVSTVPSYYRSADGAHQHRDCALLLRFLLTPTP